MLLLSFFVLFSLFWGWFLTFLLLKYSNPYLLYHLYLQNLIFGTPEFYLCNFIFLSRIQGDWKYGFNCRLYHLGPYLKVANKPVIISAPENLNLVAVYTREVALLVSAQHWIVGEHLMLARRANFHAKSRFLAEWKNRWTMSQAHFEVAILFITVNFFLSCSFEIIGLVIWKRLLKNIDLLCQHDLSFVLTK